VKSLTTLRIGIAALLLSGCAPHVKMTPAQEAAAWCALGFHAPGMAGWCDEKSTTNKGDRK